MSKNNPMVYLLNACKKNALYIICMSICVTYNSCIYTMITYDGLTEKSNQEFINQDLFIEVNFHEEPLIHIVQSIADQKNINVIFPQGGTEMKEKVSLRYSEKMDLDSVWKLVLTLLDLCEYTVLPKPTGLLIMKKNIDTLREPVPLFVNTDPFELPDTDNIIRYLYYFANIKAPTETDAELNVALKELLSSTGSFKMDTVANALLIQDKSAIIRSVAQFIKQFDQEAYQEKMEVLQLLHTEAPAIATLLNEYILKLGTNEPPSRMNNNLDNRKATDTLFAKGTKVIPIAGNNKLIILGRPQAVEKLKNFIQEQLDQGDNKRGQSVLHILPLQYIDAERFAPILQKAVDASRSGGTGQSSASSTQSTAVKGGERFFDEIIIRADKPQNNDDTKYYGGNNLVIACRNDDYEQIKQLVAQLDQPRPIVLFEMLIIDATLEDTRRIESALRNPAKIPLPGQMEVQSAQLSTSGILTDNPQTPTTIAPDLLQLNPADTGSASIAKAAAAGTTVLSLNDADGKTWGILEILKLLVESKIISQPHFVTVDNKEAVVRIGSERLVRDDTTESSGGSAIIKQKKLEALLQINITPRISPDNTVTLQIKVTIDDFLSETDATKTTREVSTCANVRSGTIFSLGGLTNLVHSSSVTGTPGLEKIPIVGWFFKGQSNLRTKNNLMVFVCPTIIPPQLRKGANDYTKQCIDMNKKFLDDSGLFTQTKDPITRWFFKNETHPFKENQAARTMIEGTESVPAFSIEQPIDAPSKIKHNGAGPSESSVQEIFNTSSEYAPENPDTEARNKTPSIPSSFTPPPLALTAKKKFEQIVMEEERSLEEHIQRLQRLLANASNPFDAQQTTQS